MGFNARLMIKELKKIHNNEIQSELKARRKKDGEWKKVPSFPCPCQCLYVKEIAPNGKQEIARTAKIAIKLRKWLIFTRKVVVKDMAYSNTTYKPKKIGQLFEWWIVHKEYISKEQIKEIIGGIK